MRLLLLFNLKFMLKIELVNERGVNKMKKILFFMVIVVMIVGCEKQLPIDAGNSWQKVADGLAFPEGPAIDNDESVYFSNCHSDWIGRLSNGHVDTIATADSSRWIKTNGMVFYQDNLYACEYGIGKIIKLGTDYLISDVVAEYDGDSFNRPNDLTIDDQGNLFFSDPKSYGPGKLDGRVFHVDLSTGNCQMIQDNLAFPNGIGISPTDGKLYLCESAKNRILRFNILPDGSLSDREVFVNLPGGDPDGINFDQAGNLYVAHFGSGQLIIISPHGKILQKIKTPGERPTNVEFGGTDNKTLYLTETETNGIYIINVSIAGA